MKKYKISFYPNSFSLSCIMLFFLASCSEKNFSHKNEYTFKSKTNIPDYSNLDYWAAHPWKKDLSDSVPMPLHQSFKQDSLADVFFIHPTTFTDKTDGRWNAEIDDAEINAKTDYSTILYQASVFNEKCRVFAPRYRQANIKAFYILNDDSEKAFDIAYTDAKAAFEFYLKFYNQGRPIIIASHSQGTKHAKRLLKEFFENKPLQNQLVCAYIIGMPVPDNYFSSLKPCTDSLTTGCFVSWRTFKSNSTEPDFITEEKFNSIVINPLSWTTETTLVPSSFNKGGVLKNFNKIVPRVVAAQIHNNILYEYQGKFSYKDNIFFIA